MSTQIQIPGINQASTPPVSDTTFTTLTGTLTQTIVKTLTLPANTLKIGTYWNVGPKDFGIIDLAVNYAGTGTTTILFYMNNVSNLSGSPVQLTGGLSAAASVTYGSTVFGITPSSGGSSNSTTRITSNTNMQYVSSTALPSGFTNSTIFDITQPIYVMVVATLNNVGTTLSIGSVLINPLKNL